MNNPHDDYTTEQALELARQCKYGPLAKPTDPTPSIDEAIEIIRNDPTMRACNWITGRDAIEVLRLTRSDQKGSNGEDAMTTEPKPRKLAAGRTSTSARIPAYGPKR